MYRNLALDVLKVILSVMIVGIHGLFLNDINPIVSDFFVNCLFRIAVPIFFIVNGFFLYTKIEKWSLFYTWVKRVIFLYFVWTLVYLPFMLQNEVNRGSHHPIAGTLINLLIGYHHLWYLPATIGAGFLLFLSKKMPENVNIIMAISLYFIGSLTEYAGMYNIFGEKVTHLITPYYVFRNFIFFGYPFLYAGCHINRAKFDKINIMSIIYIIISSLFLMCIEFYLNIGRKNLSDFHMPLSIPPFCVGIFLLGIRQKFKHNSNYLEKLPTVIYFAHPIFLEHFWLSNVQSSLIRISGTVIICSVFAVVLIKLNTEFSKHFKLSAL